MEQVEYAIIGGSSTNSVDFPLDIDYDKTINIIRRDFTMNTPYGLSPPLTLFSINDRMCLTVKFHGWRPKIARGLASQQLFWAFKELGVKIIISEGGVGAVNQLLNPRDLIMSTDYIDLSMRKDISISDEHLLIMRQPVCPNLQAILYESAQKHASQAKVFDRGIYAVTDGRHFESVAEVQMIKQYGADIIGQSMCPEVYLAREIGACYGRIDMVVNFAEGIVIPWQHKELKTIFFDESQRIGKIVLDTLLQADRITCKCSEYRKDTLIENVQDVKPAISPI